MLTEDLESVLLPARVTLEAQLSSIELSSDPRPHLSRAELAELVGPQLAMVLFARLKK
jgi:hypothetical protein